MRRLMVAFAATLALVASMLFTPANAEENNNNNDEVIETSPDEFTYWAGMRAQLYVEDNDQGWKDADYPPPVANKLRHEPFGDKSKVVIDGGIIWLKLDSLRKQDLVFEYKLAKGDNESAWTEVVVHVKPVKQIRTKQPRRGKLRIYNPNAKLAVACSWGSPMSSHPDGHQKVPTKKARVVDVKHKVSWFYCQAGKHGVILVTYKRFTDLKV